MANIEATVEVVLRIGDYQLKVKEDSVDLTFIKHPKSGNVHIPKEVFNALIKSYQKQEADSDNATVPGEGEK